MLFPQVADTEQPAILLQLNDLAYGFDSSASQYGQDIRLQPQLFYRTACQCIQKVTLFFVIHATNSLLSAILSPDFSCVKPAYDNSTDSDKTRRKFCKYQHIQGKILGYRWLTGDYLSDIIDIILH